MLTSCATVHHTSSLCSTWPRYSLTKQNNYWCQMKCTIIFYLNYNLNACVYDSDVFTVSLQKGRRLLCQCYCQSINQSILSEQMQKHCCYCKSIWEDITCREMTVKKVSFKFLFKCRQCHWWRHFWRKTVSGFCRRHTERSITDCLKTCLWHSKIRWRRRTQTLSTW